MSKRPTKDLDMAIVRLRNAAPHLICNGPHNYGGSIWSDLEAVFMALDTLRPMLQRRAQASRDGALVREP